MVTDYQKRIEEIRDNFIAKHCRCCDFAKHFYDNEIVSQLLSLLQEVRSEALEAQEKRIEGIIKGMKIRHITDSRYPDTSKDKTWQIDTQHEIDWFNGKLEDVLSKLEGGEK